jgi:hypothetical protein
VRESAAKCPVERVVGDIFGDSARSLVSGVPRHRRWATHDKSIPLVVICGASKTLISDFLTNSEGPEQPQQDQDKLRLREPES